MKLLKPRPTHVYCDDKKVNTDLDHVAYCKDLWLCSSSMSEQWSLIDND